jgi:hypothetical protein
MLTTLVNYSLPGQQCLKALSYFWRSLSIGWKDLQTVRQLQKEISTTMPSFLSATPEASQSACMIVQFFSSCF